jgi:hypothetical protein
VSYCRAEAWNTEYGFKCLASVIQTIKSEVLCKLWSVVLGL